MDESRPRAKGKAKGKAGSHKSTGKSKTSVPKGASAPAKGVAKKISVAATTVLKKPANMSAPTAGNPILYRGGKNSFSASKGAWRVWPDAAIVGVEKAFKFGDDKDVSFACALAFLDSHGVGVKK